MVRSGLVGLVLLGCVAGCAERERPQIADGRLAISDAVAFGRVPVHGVRRLDLTLKNIGRSPVQVLEVWTVGPEGAFRAQLLNKFPVQLGPIEETALRVGFSPQASGDQEGVLVVRTDSWEERLFRVPMSGEGVDAAAQALPDRLDFGRIEVGTTKTRELVLTNASELPVIARFTTLGVHANEFELPPDLPLASGASVQLPVTFAPQVVGTKAAALAFNPCQGCVDQIIQLTAEALDQAVIAVPPVLDFGQVGIDRDAVGRGVLRNISTEPMSVHAFGFDPSSDPSFVLEAAMLPTVLGANAEMPFSFRYSPGHMGEAKGEAHFQVSSRRHPITRVGLVAFGGAPELCVAPLLVDYGDVPVGSKNSAWLTVKNCGASNAAPLEVHSIEVEPGGPGAEQFAVGPVPMPQTLAAGDQMMVRTFFEPVRPGQAEAALLVRSRGGGSVTIRSALSGRASVYPPCEVEITPPLVDFGTVPPGESAVLGVKVENRGSDLCAVKNIDLVDSGHGAFAMPGGRIEGLVVPPGNAFSFQVGFAAGSARSVNGVLRMEVADPANRFRVVPLRANVETSCLVATPPFLDFGLARPDCPASPLRTSLQNACSRPVTLRDVFIGAGTTDGEFVITQAPGRFPAVLPPGDATSVEVSYLGQVSGMNLSPLFADVADLSQPLLVPLIGESSDRATQVDQFVQQDGSKADVLFIVDNTASMVEEHPRLQAAVPAFVAAAARHQVDLRIAVTTTGIEPVSSACPGGAEGGEAGRFFPPDGSRPRILTHASPDLATALQLNLQVGQCALIEQGLEAMRRALSPPLSTAADDVRTALPDDGNLGFLRLDAALAVVIFGDEDDHSPDDVATYVRFLQSVKGVRQPGGARIFAVAPTGPACGTAGGTGTRYVEAAQATGGDALSICAHDYAPLLESVAEQVFAPQSRFPLSALPDARSIVVTVDGARVGSGWTYDASSNQVEFSSQPPPGARIEVRYRIRCP